MKLVCAAALFVVCGSAASVHRTMEDAFKAAGIDAEVEFSPRRQVLG